MAFVLRTMARRGLLAPGRPVRVGRQLNALRRWGFGLAGELRQAAARSPDRIAVVDDCGASLTYASLLALSTGIAHALAAVPPFAAPPIPGPTEPGLAELIPGLSAGDRVGIMCRNSAGMLATLLGVASLGADPVLINTGLAASQLGELVDRQGLRLVIHDDEFDGVPAAVSAPLSKLVPPRPATSSSAQAPLRPATSSSAAGRTAATAWTDSPSPGPPLRPPARPSRTIVLTSGTTGTPKGARRPTPGGFGPLCSIIDRIPLRGGMRMMIAAPLFHTWGFATLQIALALRATIVLRRRFDPAYVLDDLVRHECEALIAIPVMLQRIMELPPPHRRPALDVVAVSGSALRGGLATRFMDRFGDVLYNLYGSTEVSWASIATPADLRAAPGTAGRPPHGTQVTVRDASGSPVAQGVTGRLFVHNDMLFEGYTSAACGQTPESVVPPSYIDAHPVNGVGAGAVPARPFKINSALEPARHVKIKSAARAAPHVKISSAGGPARHFKFGQGRPVNGLATGDLGHIDDAGRVFVDGRADDMIVSGGENVFPAQVEDLLSDLPEVREVAVVGVPDDDYGQRLAAYVVLRDGASLAADQIRDHVREHRARFCVPRDVFFLPALPRTATGKVLTRRLGPPA